MELRARVGLRFQATPRNTTLAQSGLAIQKKTKENGVPKIANGIALSERAAFLVSMQGRSLPCRTWQPGCWDSLPPLHAWDYLLKRLYHFHSFTTNICKAYVWVIEMKSILGNLRRGRPSQAASAAIGASASILDFGFMTINNSLGASAAISELSAHLDSLLRELIQR
jgi:hypothetical protein